MKGNMYVCERSGKHSRRRVKRTAGTDNKEHLFQDTAPRTLLPAVKSGNLFFYVRTVRPALWEDQRLSVEDPATYHQQGGKKVTVYHIQDACDNSPREQTYASNKGKKVASDLSD